MGVLYLARELFGLPFLPFDLFDWVTRILPGPIVTFGLDLFIDALRFLGFSVADTAKTAELGMAILQFFGLGVAAGAGFAVIAPLLKWDQRITGSGLGMAAGAGMIGITMAIEGSTLFPVIVVAWVMATFVTWSNALAIISERLQAPAEAAPAMQDAPDALFQHDPGPAPELQSGAMIETLDPADEPPLMDEEQAPAMGRAMAAATGGINRRDFIVRVGGSAAVITIASTAVGNYVATAARREIEEDQPMIVDTVTGVAHSDGRDIFPERWRSPCPRARHAPRVHAGGGPLPGLHPGEGRRSSRAQHGRCLWAGWPGTPCHSALRTSETIMNREANSSRSPAYPIAWAAH